MTITVHGHICTHLKGHKFQGPLSGSLIRRKTSKGLLNTGFLSSLSTAFNNMLLVIGLSLAGRFSVIGVKPIDSTHMPKHVPRTCYIHQTTQRLIFTMLCRYVCIVIQNFMFQHMLFRFFDIPKFEVIVFRISTAGLLTCSTTFPPISRGKVVYFLRNEPDKVTATNFRTVSTFFLKHLKAWCLQSARHGKDPSAYLCVDTY